MELLQELHGIGPKKAKELYDMIPGGIKSDIKNINDMRYYLYHNMYNKLPTSTIVDIEMLPQPIDRDTMDLFIQEMQKYTTGIRSRVCGSYRRGKSKMKDIDLVISRGNKSDIFNKWRNKMNESKIINIMEPYAIGSEKVNTICQIQNHDNNDKINVRMDVFLINPSEWYTAILYATGSGNFNMMMRMVAKRKGYLLNHKGLYKNGKKINISSERDVFDILGMEYLKPQDREL